MLIAPPPIVAPLLGLNDKSFVRNQVWALWFQSITDNINTTIPSTYVPYTGATGNVNLGAHSITAVGGSLTALGALTIRDTSAAYDVTLAATSSTTLTTGRTLTFDVTNAARTIKLTGNPTLADWFDQSVKQAASPTFAGLSLGSGSLTTTGAVSTGALTIGGGSTINTVGSVAAGVNASTQYLNITVNSVAYKILLA